MTTTATTSPPPNLPVPAGPRPQAGDLAQYSIIDMIIDELKGLDAFIAQAQEQLKQLGTTSYALDVTIANVYELSAKFEAPAATRAAADADNAVVGMLDNVVGEVSRHAEAARDHNTKALQSLQGALEIQDRQRSVGAGPKLLAKATGV